MFEFFDKTSKMIFLNDNFWLDVAINLQKSKVVLNINGR